MRKRKISSPEPEKVNRVSSGNRKNPMQRILEIACAFLMAAIVVLIYLDKKLWRGI